MKQTKKESKALWKLHFAKQITLAERGTILMFQKQHLDDAMCKEIQNLAEGVFNRVVLQNLVTKLATSFDSYKPDKQVMTYLHQHMRALITDNRAIEFYQLQRQEGNGSIATASLSQS